jgi:hypothetical protein
MTARCPRFNSDNNLIAEATKAFLQKCSKVKVIAGYLMGKGTQNGLISHPLLFHRIAAAEFGAVTLLLKKKTARIAHGSN